MRLTPWIFFFLIIEIKWRVDVIMQSVGCEQISIILFYLMKYHETIILI